MRQGIDEEDFAEISLLKSFKRKKLFLKQYLPVSVISCLPSAQISAAQLTGPIFVTLNICAYFNHIYIYNNSKFKVWCHKKKFQFSKDSL